MSPKKSVVPVTPAASRFSSARVLIILGALTASGPLSIDMYLPAFPSMAKDLGAPLGLIQLSVPAFLLGSAVGQLFYGPLSDLWGRRRPLLFGLALFVAAATGCAAAGSGNALICWRVAMALGGGAGMAISRAVVRDLCETTEAARMYSMLMLIMGVAPILAPTAGGQLILLAGWRGIFVFLALFGLCCFAAVAMGLPESMPEHRRIRKGPAEMARVYLHLLRNRRYMRYVIAIGCVSGTMFSYIAGAPVIFMELHGISPQAFGIFFGANAFGLIAASQVNRRLLHRFSAQQILNVAFPVEGLSVVLIALAAATGIGGFPAMVVLFFLCLTAAGFLYPNITALAMAPFDKAAGSASALMGTMQYLIAAGAGGAVGALYNGTAFPITTAILVCGISGLMVVPRREPKHAHFQ